MYFLRPLPRHFVIENLIWLSFTEKKSNLKLNPWKRIFRGCPEGFGKGSKKVRQMEKNAAQVRNS